MYLILGILDCNQDSVKVQRLLYKVECSFLDAVYGSSHVRMSRNHDNS